MNTFVWLGREAGAALCQSIADRAVKLFGGGWETSGADELAAVEAETEVLEPDEFNPRWTMTAPGSYRIPVEDGYPCGPARAAWDAETSDGLADAAEHEARIDTPRSSSAAADPHPAVDERPAPVEPAPGAGHHPATDAATSIAGQLLQALLYQALLETLSGDLEAANELAAELRTAADFVESLSGTLNQFLSPN